MSWLTSSTVLCLLIWLFSASLGVCTNVKCKDSLKHDNGLKMTVNCSTGLVSWESSTGEPAYQIYVRYQCDGNDSDNNGWERYIGDYYNPSSAKALNLTRQSQVCVFRICFERPGGSERFQSTPQICNYTGPLDTTEHDSSSLFSTPTASYVTHTQTIDLSTISNVQKTSSLSSSYNTQTKIVSTVIFSQEMPSISNLPSLFTQQLSQADPSIAVFSILGSIVLIFIFVSLFSVILTLKIKRSFRFSKGVHNISEEAFDSGQDIVYQGRIGSCVSLVTIIQPLQKEQLNAASTSVTSVSKENFTLEDTELSPFCQEEKLSLSMSFQSVSSSSVIQTESEKVIPPAESLDVAVILPDTNSGYISYKCSGDYITSTHSPHTNTVMANDFAEENYDEFSLCSQY